MKRLILSLFAIGIAANGLCAAAPASAPAQESLPANTKWVLHLDVKALCASALGKEILASLAGTPGEAKLKAFEALTSINIARDVLAITACGSGGAERGGVLYLRGNWDAQKLTAIMAGSDQYAAKPYGAHTVMSWEEKQADSAPKHRLGCFASPSLLVLTDREAAGKQALDAIDGKAPTLAGVPRYQQLNQPEGRGFLRLVAMDVTGIVPAGMQNTGPLAGVLQQLESVRLDARSDAQSVILDATLLAQTPEAALQLQRVALGFQSIALLQAGGNPDMAQVAQSARIVVDGPTIGLTVTLPLDLVRRFVNRRAEQAPGAPPAPRPTKLPPQE